jgi:hypothetical protein
LVIPVSGQGPLLLHPGHTAIRVDELTLIQHTQKLKLPQRGGIS